MLKQHDIFMLEDNSHAFVTGVSDRAVIYRTAGGDTRNIDLKSAPERVACLVMEELSSCEEEGLQAYFSVMKDEIVSGFVCVPHGGTWQHTYFNAFLAFVKNETKSDYETKDGIDDGEY